MTLQRLPYLGILAISIAALLLIASGNSNRPQPPNPRTPRPDPRAYHLLKKNHSRRRRRLGLHHLRLAHAPPLHLAANESHRSRCGLGKSCRRDSKHRRCFTASPLAPEFNRGFTSNGRAGTVTIFDMKTLTVHRHRAKPEQIPTLFVYDARLRSASFAMNGTQLEFHSDRLPLREKSSAQLR